MDNNFGRFFKQKRLEKNLTQKELANILFVSESAVSKWEKNIAHPDITLLPKLSEILDVTEHELITASIDNNYREEKKQAKKWRSFSLTWSMFFYISYTIALITCFICNLAIDGTLSWFWIVASALLLAFSFTNLPGLIKKNKLILIPLSMYLALCLLFGVCCIYTNGNWFWIPSLAVLLCLTIIFVPIYIAKLKIFSKLNKINDFISIGIDFILLNILLIVINSFTIFDGYTSNNWYLTVALPIIIYIYAVLNILLSIRFIKINKLLKTSIILTLINLFLYTPPMFIKVTNPVAQHEINQTNILNANFSTWISDITLESNIHLIIFLTILATSLAFLIGGLVAYFKRKH